MGLIGSILRLLGLGTLGDAADSVEADKIVRKKASGYIKEKATEIAIDKATGIISDKIRQSTKPHEKAIDKSDKYWYLKED